MIDHCAIMSCGISEQPLWLFLDQTRRNQFGVLVRRAAKYAQRCNMQRAGLENSAAIRPFATKNSRLASEKILLVDSLATENCHLADRLATKLFFKVDNARAAGPNVIVQGAWQSLSVQDARELAVRAPSIMFVSKSTPGVEVPSLRFSFRDHLSLVGRRKYRTRFDCQFARHISHPHESFSVRVWAEKVRQCIGRD